MNPVQFRTGLKPPHKHKTLMQRLEMLNMLGNHAKELKVELAAIDSEPEGSAPTVGQEDRSVGLIIKIALQHFSNFKLYLRLRICRRPVLPPRMPTQRFLLRMLPVSKTFPMGISPELLWLKLSGTRLPRSCRALHLLARTCPMSSLVSTTPVSQTCRMAVCHVQRQDTSACPPKRFTTRCTACSTPEA